MNHPTPTPSNSSKLRHARFDSGRWRIWLGLALVSLFLATSFVSVTSVALAQLPEQIEDKNFKPGPVPQLGVQIPGLTFGQARLENCPNGGLCVVVPYLAQYISAGYRYLIGVSFMAAIIMIMYGGFRYLIGGTTGDLKRGKEIVIDAIAGLVILLGAYAILATVNPNTLNLNALIIPYVQKDEWDGGDVNQNPQAVAETVCSPNDKDIVCSDEASCKAVCNTPAGQRPQCSRNVANPDKVLVVESSDGLENSGNIKVLPKLIEPLKKAGEIASKMPNHHYVIQLISGYRPLSEQIEIVCKKIDEKKGYQIGDAVAKPGASNHGGGFAVDVALTDGKNNPVCCGNFSSQSDSKFEAGARDLASIMEQAGFMRYNRETWHFELKEFVNDTSCRCSGAQCQFPPPKKPNC